MSKMATTLMRIIMTLAIMQVVLLMLRVPTSWILEKINAATVGTLVILLLMSLRLRSQAPRLLEEILAMAIRRRKAAKTSRGEVAFGWIFVISNFVLELVSIVTDQLSSVQNPQFALVSMLMSLLAVLICVCELVYKGRKERVQWRWRGRIPWFYYPSPSNLHFGNFADMVGLACAIPQLIATVINYYFLCRHANNPIKISFWPVIFAFGLLCSKFFENPNKQTLSPG